MGNISVAIHLDGETVGCGYKYIITKGGCSWTAYQTDAGFKNFMSVYGLKFDTKTTKYHDYRQYNKGRVIAAFLQDKVINELYFWDMGEIPKDAKKTIDLCNGSYVDCYVCDYGDRVDFYRPNPNAESVYVPHDYHVIRKRQG